jgi:hypothetical protein
VSQLKSQGFTTTDWLTGRLTPEEVEETVQQIALLHAAGLAYRLVPKSVGWWLLSRTANLSCRLVLISDARWLCCEEVEVIVQ